MAKFVKNIDTISHTWAGVIIEPNSLYECQNRYEAECFYRSDTFIIALSNGKAEVYSDNILINGIEKSLTFLKNVFPVDDYGNLISSNSPFAMKKVNGKSLFKRVHGMQLLTVIGLNTFEFNIPYNQCKITGIELIGASSCDIADLEVYDTPTGTISTIPNYLLNQFGFTVNVAKDYYAHRSEFDSDLIKDMKIEVHLYAQAVGLVGLNLILNEVK